MRKLIIIFFALVLVACSAPATPTQQPVAAPAEPSQTAVVVVITATSAPTEAVPPTELPTYTPLPTYTVPPPPTEAAQQPAPTEAVAAPPTEAAASGGPITIDDKLGNGWFVGMTRDRNDFSLRCQINKTITFSVKVTSDTIKSVDFWYRFEDRATGAVFDWTNLGKMIPDLNGGYTITVTGEQTNPNFRKPNSYFDYQFVAYNPTGVIGRSEKIERQVTFTFNCP
ncbi:MAG TPA: hypothetical protein VLE49_05120 [Anaerolineales bacterium]|nr:hypothetical protein [Anaerolineales bacterium]